MTNLSKGANSALSTLTFIINHQFTSSTDISVFCLDENGKVVGDEGMVFYGAPNSSCGTIKLLNDSIAFDLNKVPNGIKKFAVTATLDKGTFNDQANVKLHANDFECLLETTGLTETSMILLEIYNRNNAWKVRFVSQGFNGGLQPLAELYGVEIDSGKPEPEKEAGKVSQSNTRPQANSTPQANTTSQASNTVNLSKISLTKAEPKVDLTKPAGSLGLIKANLNWNQQSGGFFASKVDLDLGAYIELNNGVRKIVQALGNGFAYPPYIKLLADDRTGASIDGEWIHINGDMLQDVKKIIIFAFIYQGAANWEKADAQVTLHVPDMPPIETKLTERDKSKGFCAIAELSNHNGKVKVEQLNRLFKGHQECDQAFGWGFDWRAGRK